MVIQKEPFLPSARPCFGSEIGGQKYHRLPHDLLNADPVPQRAWLKPPVATGVCVCHRRWASFVSTYDTNMRDARGGCTKWLGVTIFSPGSCNSWFLGWTRPKISAVGQKIWRIQAGRFRKVSSTCNFYQAYDLWGTLQIWSLLADLPQICELEICKVRVGYNLYENSQN